MDSRDAAVLIVGIGSLLSVVLFSLKKIKYIRCCKCECEQKVSDNTPSTPRPNIVENMERAASVFNKSKKKQATPNAFFVDTPYNNKASSSSNANPDISGLTDNPV